jgi:MFS transporter, DHA1 family, tetracycline resistance protein
MYTDLRRQRGWNGSMTSRSAPLNFVLVCVLIDTMSIGIILPSLPILIGKFAASGGGAATLYGWLVSTFGVASFLATPIVGGLSDRFGRKPVLLFSMAGMCCNFLLTAHATSLLMLFAGRIVAGVSSGSIAVASAYAADVSQGEMRTKAFGQIGAAYSVGLIMGPLAGGILGAHSIETPFYVAAALTLCNLIYGYVAVPESLDKAARVPFSFARSNPVNALSRLATHPATRQLYLIFGLLTFSQLISQTSFPLYTVIRFHWTSVDIGLALFLLGVSSTLMQMVLLGRLLKRLGETRLVYVAILSGMTNLSLYGLATHGWMIYLAVILGILGFACYPALQGIVSRQTDPRHQGELMGSLQALNSLAIIVSPLIGTSLLAVNANGRNDWALGTPFLLSVGLQLLALICLHRYFQGLQAAASSLEKREQKVPGS